MEFIVKSAKTEKLQSACIVTFIFSKRKLSNSATEIDKISNGYISNIVNKGDIEGDKDQSLLLYSIPNIASERILLIGVGKEKEVSEKQFVNICKIIFQTLKSKNITNASLAIEDYPIDKSFAWKVKQAILAYNDVFYNFDKYKSNKSKDKQALKKITFITSSRKELKNSELAVDQALAISKGINYTKNLANLPGNDCNPAFLAKEAQNLAKKYSKISSAVLNKKDMQALKMGAILAVGQGSKNEPKLITMEYRGGKTGEKPIVFIGKGITFDTGGNSIKPAEFMVGMKYDMCGAATVFGLLTIAAELELPLNIIGVIAAAENMPGGNAIRPDDIITSMSGTTIEVLNTDAEGRLVLCDALTYSERYNPQTVIDIATLTGACVIALGKHNSGLFSNTDNLVKELIDSGKESLDTCWHLPIGPEYKDQLKSNFADLANIGGKEAGSITAACFLAHFAEKYKWAHLDIAGTGSNFNGKDKAATGRPVPLLAEYLLSKC